MHIVLPGATSQVGRELQRTLGVLGDVVTVARELGGDRQLDLVDTDGVRRMLDAAMPDVIINAAA